MAEMNPRERRRSPIRIIGPVAVVLILVFLYLPPIVMGVFSFNTSVVETLPIKGFGTTWYEQLIHNQKMIGALVYSLEVSLTAVLVSLVAGTTFAIVFARGFRGSTPVQLAITLPMLLPGMVLGISLLLSFKTIGVLPGFFTVVVAHAVFLTPVVQFIVAQRLTTLDPSLAQASLDLGASRLRTFREITLPLLGPAMLASALLCFTLSFDELAVTFFVTGFDQTLPVYVFSLLRLGFTPQVNAIFTILAGLSVLAVIIAGRVVTSNRARPQATDEPITAKVPASIAPRA